MAKKAGKKQARSRAERPVKKAFPLVGRNDLNRLLEQVAIFQNRAGTANSSAAELVSTYVKSKHLHAGAFRVVNRWKKLGDRDPEALWLELAHVDDMRAKCGLDRIAQSQGQLLPAISDDLEPHGDTTEQQNENVVPWGPRDVEEQAGENVA